MSAARRFLSEETRTTLENISKLVCLACGEYGGKGPTRPHVKMVKTLEKSIVLWRTSVLCFSRDGTRGGGCGSTHQRAHRMTALLDLSASDKPYAYGSTKVKQGQPTQTPRLKTQNSIISPVCLSRKRTLSSVSLSLHALSRRFQHVEDASGRNLYCGAPDRLQDILGSVHFLLGMYVTPTHDCIFPSLLYPLNLDT